MKSQKNEITQRYLQLFKIDADNLLRRIQTRRKEFVEIFAMRRTREHFSWVFSSRYERATVKDLAHCSAETIIALDQFYGLVDEMKWYLFQTEDMPNTVEESVFRMTKRLEKLHATVTIYLDAELSLDQTTVEQDNLSEGERFDLNEAQDGELFSSEGDDPMLSSGEGTNDSHA